MGISEVAVCCLLNCQRSQLWNSLLCPNAVSSTHLSLLQQYLYEAFLEVTSNPRISFTYPHFDPMEVNACSQEVIADVWAIS